MTARAPLVKIEALSKRYGSFLALDAVDLAVEAETIRQVWAKARELELLEHLEHHDCALVVAAVDEELRAALELWLQAFEAIAAEPDAQEDDLVILQRAQMVRERARVPEREYSFKHHLTQEAAYASLLVRERRAHHRQVAETVERLYAERLEELLGLLAHHPGHRRGASA